MKIIKKILFLIGIAFSLASLMMYLRIFLIISMGFQYIAYESNPIILYSEILISLTSIIIMFGLMFEVMNKN